MIIISMGDIQQGNWRNDLVFDIDYFMEWVCDVERCGQFLVAPAIRTFHHVTDLRIGID